MNSELHSSELPGPSQQAKGCLCLSGCLGNLGLAMLGVAVMLQSGIIVASWIKGTEFQWVQFSGEYWLWFFWIMSWIGYRALVNRTQRPWVYYLVAACLAMWCCFVLCCVQSSPTVSGFTKEQNQMLSEASRWLVFGLTCYVFGRFCLSRENRIYFGITKPSPTDALPPALPPALPNPPNEDSSVETQN